jgi:hypothetical protein
VSLFFEQQVQKLVEEMMGRLWKLSEPGGKLHCVLVAGPDEEPLVNLVIVKMKWNMCKS